MVIGSKELIRDMNSKLVLETIMTANAISRAAISKQLGLTKATISAIVNDLINSNLVIEIGSDDTLLGRKPILLSFNKKAGYSISIDIGNNMLSALAADLQGETSSLKQIKTPGEAELITSLMRLIESIMKEQEEMPYGLIGITLGIHGVTNNNQVIFTPYYDLSSLKLAETLSDYFNVPVYLENEANLSALGELTYLSNQYSNIANISIHSGVGLGLIINHKLYTGAKGFAGEFGHTIIEIDGRECPCGNKGCLEQYTSERSLLKEYAAATHQEKVNFTTFAKDYREKNPTALFMADHFIKYMSVCINNLLNSYNPEIVIINSAFTIEFPELTKAISESLHSRMNDRVPIVNSLLKDNSILIGGICVAVKNFLGIDKITFITEKDYSINN